MLGFPLDDWLNVLKMKTKEQLVEWIIGWQMENWGMEIIMNYYVLLCIIHNNIFYLINSISVEVANNTQSHSLS